MAYSFIKNKKGGVGVLLDSAADISLVPVDQFFPGTFAFTADGSARYRLSTSRSWVEVAGGGVTPGGGLPEVSGSGKALISVNGEWVEQDGYGYSGGTSYVPVTEQSVTLEDQGGDANFGYFGESIEIVAGETYKVTINDSEYDNVVAFAVSDAVVITDDQTFANFNFMITTQSVTSSIGSQTLIGEVSVKVEKLTETVHKIDSKYLPNSEPVRATITATGESTLTCDVDFETVLDAAKSGNLFAVWNIGENPRVLHVSSIRTEGNSPYVELTSSPAEYVFVVTMDKNSIDAYQIHFSVDVTE